MNESHQIKGLKSLVVYLQRYVDRRLWLKLLIAMASGVGVGIGIVFEVRSSLVLHSTVTDPTLKHANFFRR